MINVFAQNPTDLFIKLGKLFFYAGPNPIDIYVGDRRFVSVNNVFRVGWPKEWTGTGLYKLVGYSDRGSKMDTLRKTYVNEDSLDKLKYRLKTQHKGFEIIGMQFNMSMEKKGGCLSSLHILRDKKDVLLFIHGKIAEIPRKFVADLLLVRDLINELELGEPSVIFQYSIIYYSIVSLRAYLPILGKDEMEKHMDFPIDKPRDYQVGTQESLMKVRKELIEKYGREVMNKGMLKHIDYQRGELK